MHHPLPPVWKFNNLKDHSYSYELPDFWKPNSPHLNLVHCKIWGKESTSQKCRMWMIEAASDWCVSWSGTEHCWWWHWPVSHTFPYLHSSHRRTFEYSLWKNSHNIIKCNKLSLTLLLNKTFVSECCHFYDIYLTQGSVAMCLRCDGIFNYYCITCLLPSLTVKEFGQPFVKLWARVGCLFFLTDGVLVSFFISVFDMLISDENKTKFWRPRPK